MNKIEQRRNDIIVKYINKELTTSDVCRLLNVTDRHVRRLKAKYLIAGITSIPHGNKNKRPHNKTDNLLEQTIIELYKNEYWGWNFIHFNENLKTHHNIFVSDSAVYNILSRAGIISSKAKKKKKKSNPPRPRRETFGELVQIDASIHKWFSDETYALHGAIDDATGTVLGAYFDKEETTYGYYKTLEMILNNYGIPKCLYSDNRSTFKSTKKELTIEEELKDITINKTNFEVSISKLNISLITTSNPKAKGRIERLWQTFQDRLIKEMKRLNIHSVEEANDFLKLYLTKHNNRFALPLDNIKSSFLALDKSLDLNMILSMRKKLSVHHHSYLSYNNAYYVILDEDKTAFIDTKNKVDLVTRLDKLKVVEYNDKIYNIKNILNIPKVPIKEKETKPRVSRPVPDNHPWKNCKPIVHTKKLKNLMYSS